MKHVPPSVRETAFNCPHCGALTTQFWYLSYVLSLGGERKFPMVVRPDFVEQVNLDEIQNAKERKKAQEFLEKASKGYPFLSEDTIQRYGLRQLHNISVSQCFNCNALSIWLYDKLVYPQFGEAPDPNPDLSEDIRNDYIEASSILNFSPRGAAALLRLTIQKLCKDLGLPGKNLNEDIGTLVERGLDPRIQKSLDAVRVIGNNAVHPGQMDLRDDRATASRMFSLVNFIAQKMISDPKEIDELYDDLPERDLEAIVRRDSSK